MQLDSQSASENGTFILCFLGGRVPYIARVPTIIYIYIDTLAI